LTPAAPVRPKPYTAQTGNIITGGKHASVNDQAYSGRWNARMTLQQPTPKSKAWKMTRNACANPTTSPAEKADQSFVLW
jgi:hypothetical protein